VLPSGWVLSVRDGTASIRNPATPGRSQDDAIFLISPRTRGLLMLRSGWNRQNRWQYQAPAVLPQVQVSSCPPGKTMPWRRPAGSRPDQTCQSRHGESAGERADPNHGCPSDAWLTTRSMMTRIPRLPAACTNTATSPGVPSRGGTL